MSVLITLLYVESLVISILMSLPHRSR